MYRLRELEREDLKIINLWRNDKKLIELLGAPFRYINEEVEENWFDNYMKNRGGAVRCSILDDTDKVIGLVSLTNIDFQNQSAAFHIMIGESRSQNLGAGTFAVNTMISHAFLNMNLQRIELSVLTENERAIHLYEKCGFVREGEKRNVCFKNGRFVNMYIYSILRDEWKKQNIFGGVTEIGIPNYCILKVAGKQAIKQLLTKFDMEFNPNISKSVSSLDEFAMKLNRYSDVMIAFNEKIIGFIAFYANDYCKFIGYISLIAVEKTYRKRNVGSKLLSECERIALSKGMKELHLEVYDDNAMAINFYEKHGFCKMGIRKEKSHYMSKVL